MNSGTDIEFLKPGEEAPKSLEPVEQTLDLIPLV